MLYLPNMVRFLCPNSQSYVYFSTKREKQEKETLAAYRTCPSVMSCATFWSLRMSCRKKKKNLEAVRRYKKNETEDETAGEKEKRQDVKTHFIMKPKQAFQAVQHACLRRGKWTNTPKGSSVLSFQLS